LLLLIQDPILYSKAINKRLIIVAVCDCCLPNIFLILVILM